MNLQVTFENNRITRQRMLDVIGDWPLEELIKIPETHNNNLLWNFGHSVVTQHLLSFGVCKMELQIPMEIVNKFRKGSNARGVEFTQQELDYFKGNVFKYTDLTEEYLNKGKFQNFSEYTTSYGATLKSIEDAISFNNIHEGLHLGYMMALQRLL
ncbi:MAG: hypothetical protein CL840_20325 [Crocinitomicaceae bacterium]|nr:hypothetical protein [Crocinitomicaceae bacterium]|tara:strand:+ start:1094 stop:1558 length:465 start_codon:yes stop_codon:yes gene_type:complete